MGRVGDAKETGIRVGSWMAEELKANQFINIKMSESQMAWIKDGLGNEPWARVGE